MRFSYGSQNYNKRRCWGGVYPSANVAEKCLLQKKPGQNRLRQIKSVSPSNKVCLPVTSSIGVDTPIHYPRKHLMLPYIRTLPALWKRLFPVLSISCVAYIFSSRRRSRSGYVLYVYLSGTPPRSKQFVNLLAEGTNGLIHCYVFKTTVVLSHAFYWQIL